MQHGNLGEISAIKEFIRQGFEVYKSVSDNSLYDFIAAKDGELFKVEVKSTKTSPRSNGVYKVQLKRVRSNKNENRIHYFDNSRIDILVIYIEIEDKILLFNAKDLKVKTELTIDIHQHENSW